MTVTIKDIQNAAKRIKPYIHRTPILTSSSLNEITHAQLFFKCENFQKIGAFKFRGACNAVFSLSEEEAKHGVATHSSGNHGAALALAARKRGIPAYIVMPNNSPAVKKQAVAGYGATIIFCEPGLAPREAALQEVIKSTGAVLIHPYNNEAVIAGQGTAAMEFLEQHTEPLDLMITPVGGGGLISGTATTIAALSPHTKVIGAEPTAVNDAWQSLRSKKIEPPTGIPTICDGLTTSLGSITFPIILEKVSDIYTASEQSIITALRTIWERMKIIVEPSSAVTLAIILEHPEAFKDKKIGIILSGGNVDIKAMGALM